MNMYRFVEIQNTERSVFFFMHIELSDNLLYIVKIVSSLNNMFEIK